MGMPTALVMRSKLTDSKSLKPMILRAKVLICELVNPSFRMFGGTQTYVEEAKVERPEYQEHANCKEHVGRLTKGSPFDDWSGFSRWQTRSEQEVDQDGKAERNKASAADRPRKAFNKAMS